MIQSKDLLAIVEVTYNDQELLEGIRHLYEKTRKKALYGFIGMKSLEGNYLITKDYKLIPTSFTDIESYRAKLLTIEAKIGAESSTFEYLLGIKRGEKVIKPHAHVRNGKGILPLGTILNFD